MMKYVAIALGVIALAGTILIAVAGSSQPHSNAMGAVALLACIVAVVLMIVLGVTLGGRNNPRRGPYTALPEDELEQVAVQGQGLQGEEALRGEPVQGVQVEDRELEAVEEPTEHSGQS
jgi:hypothetical protein